MQAKRTLRLGLERSGVMEQLTQVCHELADLRMQKLNGFVSALERKGMRVFGVGIETGVSLRVFQA